MEIKELIIGVMAMVGIWAAAADYTYDQVLALGLPVVVIETVDHQEPTCEYVSHPAGAMGESITNAIKVPGRVDVIATDGEVLYSSGEYEKKNSGMTIKVRGNTSAYNAKKPYKIKLEKKGDLFCRGDEKYNDKNWILLNDEAGLHSCGYKVNELLGFPWTPAHHFVNVWFNGEYRGMYLLVEAVERNTECRIDIKKTGYIVELDAYWWVEPDAIVQSMWNPAYNYTFKYPDYEDMDQERIADAASRIGQLERGLIGGEGSAYLDLRSAALWMLGHDIAGTYDSGGANKYFSLYDDGESTKWQMALMWDFDGSHSGPDTWSRMHTDAHLGCLFDPDKHQDFISEYVRAWQELEEPIFDGLRTYINSMEDSDEWKGFDNSSRANKQRWPDAYTTSRGQLARNWQSWFARRKGFLETNIKDLENGIPAVISDHHAIDITAHGSHSTLRAKDERTKITLYNMQGQIQAVGYGSIDVSGRGLYIVEADGYRQKIALR